MAGESWPVMDSRRQIPGSETRGAGARSWLLAVTALPLLLLLTIPVAALVLRTPISSLGAAVSEGPVAQAIMLSVTTSATALVASMVFGTPVAYLLARRRFPGRAIIDGLVDLPLVLPPAAAGLALLLAFGRFGLVGSWFSSAGISLSFSTTAVVIAQVFVAAPAYVRSARAAFEAIDNDLLEAATIDGAGPWRRFAGVTIPLARPGLLAGAALCLARALGEFGATIIFAGNYPGRTQTMPLAIYLGFEIDMTRALVLGVVLLVISALMLAAVRLTASARN